MAVFNIHVFYYQLGGNCKYLVSNSTNMSNSHPLEIATVYARDFDRQHFALRDFSSDCIVTNTEILFIYHIELFFMRVVLILNVIKCLRNPLIVTPHIEILISLFDRQYMTMLNA